MEPEALQPRFPTVEPPSGKRPAGAWPLLLWLPGAAAVGAAVGWTGQAVQSGVTMGEAQVRFAPWLLFPLFLGAVLGGVLFALMRVLQLGHWPSVLGGAVPAVIIAVLVQHDAAYRDCRAVRLQNQQHHARLGAAHPALQKQLGEHLPPEGLLAYLKAEAARGRPLTAFWRVRGVWAWLSWALDALLTAAVALGMVLGALGQPYCVQCRSWYRTVRRGRLKGPAAGELVGLLFEPPQPAARAANYRLQECLGGCGPARLTLTVAWPPGASESGEWWLDATARGQVAAALERTRASRTTRGRADRDSSPQTEDPSPDGAPFEP